MEQRKIAILGSTGSIGTQALDVVRANQHLFEIRVLTAGRNAQLLVEQAKEFKPQTVVIGDEEQFDWVRQELDPLDIVVYAGAEALEQVVTLDSIDMVLTALVGFAGLKPTIAAIKSGKHIALANKETLVVAGDLITRLARENKVAILPVDSEHSAIYQCLVGEQANPIEKIYLTASGGPFRGYSSDQLDTVTPEKALKHPNWDMGAKITIDSATLMNKGLEVIEAKWLFDLRPEQIDVIVHPQSILHSIVQFEDGSMKAQMGLPDMKLPIQYAMAFPQRIPSTFERFDFLNYPQLTFEKPDMETFTCLKLAFESLEKGGNAPCILNAANEVAVAAFLKNKVKFREIPEIVYTSLTSVKFIEKPDLEQYLETDKAARLIAEEAIANRLATKM